MILVIKRSLEDLYLYRVCCEKIAGIHQNHGRDLAFIHGPANVISCRGKVLCDCDYPLKNIKG